MKINPNLIVERAKEDINTFVWRDSYGTFYLPINLNTHRLFYIIASIWDFKAPESMRLSYKINSYLNDEFYTKEYLSLALKVLIPEFLARKNIAPQHKIGFMKIVEYEKELKNDK